VNPDLAAQPTLFTNTDYCSPAVHDRVGTVGLRSVDSIDDHQQRGGHRQSSPPLLRDTRPILAHPKLTRISVILVLKSAKLSLVADIRVRQWLSDADAVVDVLVHAGRP